MVDVDPELTGVLDYFAVECEDHVLDLDAGGGGAAPGHDVGNQGAGFVGQFERGGEHRGDGLDHEADLAPADASILADLLVDGAYDGAGRGEPDSETSPRFGQDERVDADDLSIDV